VSLRTPYRDIDTPKAQGAHIDGEVALVSPPSWLHAAAVDVLRRGDRGAGARIALGRRGAPTGHAARGPATRRSRSLRFCPTICATALRLRGS
jgi:hypothetical protein